MNPMDIEELVSDIENALADNGIALEVTKVTPEEVKDDAAVFDTFRMLHSNHDRIDGYRAWIKLAYGESFAFVGVRQGGDRIEALVDVGENCTVDNLDRMIADGIRSYALRAGVEDVKIVRK
jgi:hypothetical protein